MNLEPDTYGPAPVLVARAERPRGTVLLLHGQGADALANAKELALLAGAGFNAVGLDAPQHGRRYEEARDASWVEDEPAALRAHIEDASAEIPSVLDACETAGLGGPFAITGISLGAFTVWPALLHAPRLAAAVPILGSPVMPGDPNPDPAPWHGKAVLALNAEHDEVVPLDPTRSLVEAIGGDLHVLRGAPHRVPELQWWASWGRAISWLRETL